MFTVHVDVHENRKPPPLRLVPTTVPWPGPLNVTVSGRVKRVNVAVTVLAWSKVTEHEPVPEQPPPDQPAKKAVSEDVTVVSVSWVPRASVAVVLPQNWSQVRPAGELFTV